MDSERKTHQHGTVPVGLRLPHRALRRLQEVGIYCRQEVSLEHQHLAKRYVVRGVESGGAIKDMGRYVTFAGPDGKPLCQLQPLDSLGVNGVHSVVVAPVLVRVEMFRFSRTYQLMISQHEPGDIVPGRRPALISKEVFRGVDGYLGLELCGRDKELAGSALPEFFSRSGERTEVPARFQEAVRAITAAVNCLGCAHSHYLKLSTPMDAT
jgi:hypothetical protein